MLESMQYNLQRKKLVMVITVLQMTTKIKREGSSRTVYAD